MITPTQDVVWLEDGTATTIARLAGPGGTGEATGNPGEGYWVKQADVSSITYASFNETTGSSTAVSSGTVTLAGAILDTPVKGLSPLWNRDTFGYNFVHSLPPACFPTGGNVFRVEYKITYASGAIGWGKLRGQAEEVVTS